jgi:protein-disulfide isomerase
MSTRRTQLIVIGLFATVILIVAIALSLGGSDGGEEPSGDLEADAASVERTLEGIDQDGVRLGDPAAPATVIEFVDLQCPFCAEFAREALPEVVERRVRTGEVALELRVISFLGDDSSEAAELAAAASLQNRLFDFAELFFLNQGEENSGFVTDEFLTEIAEATPGLDAEEALDARDSPEARAVIDENEALAQELGVDSTPTFLLARGEGQPRPLELDALTAEAFDRALSGG